MTRGTRAALLACIAGGCLWIGVKAIAQVTGTGGSTLTPAQVAALAPVQRVNQQTGEVTVPAVQRQVSAALDATAGTVSWTFPSAFANSPTCWISVATAATNFSFDAPIVTAISKAAVSVKISAHPSTLAVTSLALPISLPLTVNPPPGTTATLSCVGALP